MLSINFHSAAEISSSPTLWLWPGRIPLGAISLIEGDPGRNKSSLIYDLAAKLTAGRALFGTSKAMPAHNVLVFQAEDQPGVIKERLFAAAADMRRVHLCTEPTAISLPHDIPEIERQIVALGAKLAVFDPVTVYFGSALHTESATRRITTPLAAMAERTGCAVVLVRHLRKTGGSVLHRGLGSIGLVAAARSAFLVAVDPSTPEQRVLVHIKSSLGALSPSLSFRPVQRDSGMAIEWLGEAAYTASDFAGSDEGGVALGEAKRVLISMLASGPLRVNEVKILAANAGVSARTLQRAKRTIGVASRRVGFGPGAEWYWCLVENDAVKTVGNSEHDELCNDLAHGSPLDGLRPAPRELPKQR